MYKDAPKQAWKIGFGDVSENRATNTLAPYANNRQRTITGIPLGGMGSASCMYNYTGTFGPWQLKTGRLNRSFLDSAAFHARECTVTKAGESRITAKTLAAREKQASTGNVLKSAWREGLLEVGSADYYALYPRGWVDYRDNFTTRLKMEFFSPLIAHNYRKSSFPVANFIFSAENPTDQEIQLSIMLTFPNMQQMVDKMYIGSAIIANNQQEEDDATISNAIPRRGLKNEVRDEKDALGLLMWADSPDNTLEVQGSEFCIAAGKADGITVTHACWDADGDGGDICFSIYIIR